jgi:hypothetical protein
MRICESLKTRLHEYGNTGTYVSPDKKAEAAVNRLLTKADALDAAIEVKVVAK